MRVRLMPPSFSYGTLEMVSEVPPAIEYEPQAQDGFCPIGPWIVTSDEISDPQNLAIKCSLNGEEKQSSNTNNLIHKIPDVIQRISALMTLLPGDMILTGTPGGVGAHRKPPQFLKPGDVLSSEIQNIGVLETRVEQF